MKFPDILAALRKPGRTDEQIRACLDALCVPLDKDDIACKILDVAIKAFEDYEEGQKAVAEMVADDLDRERYRSTGELDARHYAEVLAVRSIGVLA